MVGEVNDWYSYQAKKTAPKPSHRRLPPSKVVRPAPALERRPEPIEVTESEASDSMILRAFKFWQR